MVKGGGPHATSKERLDELDLFSLEKTRQRVDLVADLNYLIGQYKDDCARLCSETHSTRQREKTNCPRKSIRYKGKKGFTMMWLSIGTDSQKMLWNLSKEIQN